MAPVTKGAAGRMSSQDRREQLLEVGARLFAEQSYDEVWIQDVARQAGISRGLLYHYFPTKRDFFVAVLEHNGERLRVVDDPALTPGEQLREGIRRFMDQISGEEEAYRAAHRLRQAQDPEVAPMMEAGIRALGDKILHRIMTVAGMTGEPPEPLRLTVHGWLYYLHEVVLAWLDGGTLQRENLIEMLAGTLESGVRAALAPAGGGLRPC